MANRNISYPLKGTESAIIISDVEISFMPTTSMGLSSRDVLNIKHTNE